MWKWKISLKSSLHRESSIFVSVSGATRCVSFLFKDAQEVKVLWWVELKRLLEKGKNWSGGAEVLLLLNRTWTYKLNISVVCQMNRLCLYPDWGFLCQMYILKCNIKLICSCRNQQLQCKDLNMYILSHK